MNPIVFQMILTALGGAADWDSAKFKEFCSDVSPLIDNPYASYYQFCPIYDKYIHKLDKVSAIIQELDKHDQHK